MLATHLMWTRMGCSWVDKISKPWESLAISSSVALIELSTVLRITPNKVMICMGTHWDLSSLRTKLDFNRSECTTKLLTLAETGWAPPPRPSSRKMAMGMPLFLHDLRSGLKILVKRKGLKTVQTEGRKTENIWKIQIQNPKRTWGTFDAREKSRCDDILSWDQIWINENPYQRVEWPRLTISCRHAKNLFNIISM